MVFMLGFVSLACNAFAGNLEPFPEPPTTNPGPSPTETADLDSAATTAPTSSITDSGTAAVTMLVDLNVRSGPGVQYDRVGFLSEGSSVAVIGVDKQTSWWKIDCPASITVDQCWVAGGAQYVALENVQDVPTVVAPPTPTTIPPTLEAGRGLIAYLDDGRLFVASLDLSQNPPDLSSDAQQVSAAAGVGQFAFSPEGHRIAYIAGTELSNSLNIVNLDGGDHRTLVASSILPLAEGQNIANGAVLIDSIQWLPDARGIAFNSRVQNLDGPGGGSQEDLWLATLDGQLINSFSAGEGGGLFAFESTGLVLMSRAGEIARADLGTSEQDILLRFEPVNTASETTYYPALEQTGSGLYMAIPASDPWLPGASTALWRAPVNTQAIEIGRIADIPLDQPVAWSSDGRQTVFIQQSSNGEQFTLRLFTAERDGSEAVPYAGSPYLKFFEWKPGGDQFLYTGDGFYAVGRPQAPPVQILLPDGQMVTQGRWLSGDSFVIVTVDTLNQGWQIQSANTSGDSLILADGSDPQTMIDVWLPGG
jgi:hypothetical protein